jgi:hypothetical protein
LILVGDERPALGDAHDFGNITRGSKKRSVLSAQQSTRPNVVDRAQRTPALLVPWQLEELAAGDADGEVSPF